MTHFDPQLQLANSYALQYKTFSISIHGLRLSSSPFSLSLSLYPSPSIPSSIPEQQSFCTEIAFGKYNAGKMPAPSRDRLPRPVDISTLFRGAARRVDLIIDEPGLRWVGLSKNLTRNVSGSGPYSRRVGVGHNRSLQRSPAVGRENRAPVTPARRGGRSGNVLPYWYPRSPLRDITPIVRAIERRRAELQVDDEVIESSSENTTNRPSVSGAQLEHHELGASTPLPTVFMKPKLSPATQAIKLMDCITLDGNWPDSDFLTPQKKLLNSIEKVKEVWLEEQRKLEKTPAARKFERERKVRTLLSMR